MSEQKKEIPTFTTKELADTIDNISCGFITIQKFMDYVKFILDEDSQSFIEELSKELEDTIDKINEVV